MRSSGGRTHHLKNCSNVLFVVIVRLDWGTIDDISLLNLPDRFSCMHTYQLSGISDRSMGAYLAGLGLMRIIERHVDKTAQFYWQGLDFWIDTKVPQAELIES